MKKQINLYQPSCYPKREKATFKQFLILFALCFFSLAALYLIINKQLADTQERTRQHKALLIKKQSELSALITELQNNRAPESKLQQQRALQDEIAVKQRLLASLAGVELGETVSFSALMRGLSLAHTGTVSINNFSIIDGRLNISGQARESDSVPRWLTKIQTTQELSGIAFETLTISDSVNSKGFSFQLSNDVKTESVKVQAQ